MSNQTREEIDAIVIQVEEKYRLLAPDQSNFDKVVQFLFANYGGYFSVSNLTTAIETLRPQLIWLKEPWQPLVTKPNTPKPPKPQPGPLGPQDAARIRDELRAEANNRQQRVKQLADEALKKQQAADADPYPAPVYYPGGKINHGKTAELRNTWAKRHPDAKK